MRLLANVLLNFKEILEVTVVIPGLSKSTRFKGDQVSKAGFIFAWGEIGEALLLINTYLCTLCFTQYKYLLFVTTFCVFLANVSSDLFYRMKGDDSRAKFLFCLALPFI